MTRPSLRDIMAAVMAAVWYAGLVAIVLLCMGVFG